MKNLKNPIAAVFLAIVVLVILGYNFDIHKSKTPVEYVISSVENFDNTPQGVFRRAWRLVKNNYVDKTCNHQDWEKWKKRYEDKIETYADSHIAIETMLSSLNDPYSRFLSVEEFSEQDMNMDAKLKGIGVHITEIDGKVTIISVIEDTPAQRGGLKEKDEIVKVNDKTVKGLSLSKVAEFIRGEEGSVVTLSILRNDELITKNITREEIRIKTVKSRMLKNNIAYIRINSFISFDTAKEFENALLEYKDADGLIVDVRGNYGGLLTNAIYVTNMFVDEGNIVSIVDRNGKKQDFEARPTDCLTNKPTIVLIDEASASASEIFSGALKDYERALLVGERTFGKGKVQMVLRLPDKSGINLTVAKYLTPSGRDIDHKGIEPDYEIETDFDNLVGGEDVCLDKAVELLQN